jgi:hypothetical protein
MDTTLTNVNLAKFNILGSSILFEFLNSHNGELCNKIECKNTWKLSFETFDINEEDFPVFICDVRLKKLSKNEVIDITDFLNYSFKVQDTVNCYLLCMDSGEVSISLICENVILISQ